MNLQPGDPLLISAPHCGGRTIQACTAGWYNHAAIITPGDVPDQLLWWESTVSSRVPDHYTGEVVKGVQAHAIPGRLAECRAQRAQVWHFPLREPLSDSEAAHLKAWCKSQHGRPYDYWGAAAARVWLGGTIRRWRRLVDDDLTRYLCSEFVAAAERTVDRFGAVSAEEWSPSSLADALVALGICWPPVLMQGEWRHWAGARAYAVRR